jgi:hypothetical protein
MKTAAYVYKCRLCGENFDQSYGSKKWAIMEVCNTLAGENNVSTLLESHCCKDGSIGIGDFIGVQFIKDVIRVKNETCKNKK